MTRSLRLSAFPTDGSAEWLAPKDLALACAIVRTVPSAAPTVVEIGVWKGAWALGILENCRTASVVGVDPYPGPGGPSVRAELERRVTELGVGSRFQLTPSRDAAATVLAEGSVPLIHVDGLHTEAAVAGDLRWAGGMLSSGGVIVVDDYRHPWFPGISSAMHSFLGSDGFRMVLTTEHKAYLCRAEDHAAWTRVLEELLGEGSEIAWSRHLGERDGSAGYVQAPDVRGHGVLLALGDSDVRPARSEAPGAAADRVAPPRGFARLRRTTGRAIRVLCRRR